MRQMTNRLKRQIVASREQKFIFEKEEMKKSIEVMAEQIPNFCMLRIPEEVTAY